MRYTALLVIILVTTISMAQAEEIYKWVDSTGKIHFGDTKPETLKAETIDINIINSIKSVKYESSHINIGKKVIIYTTSRCGYCKKAKRHFKEKGIRYKEMNIENSKNAKRQFEKMKGTGVPIILVGNKRMNGFSKAGFDRLYSRRK
jgi:glutaredoxin